MYYWTAKRLKELKERGYKLRFMTLKQANEEVTSSQASSAQAPNLPSKAQASSLPSQDPGSKHQGTSEPSPCPGHKQQE